MAFRPSRFKTTLARSLAEGGSETEIFLSSLTTRQGHVMAFADLGATKAYLKLNPGTDYEEIVSFTGIDTSGTIPKVTGVVRGYNDYNGSTSSTNKKPHSAGETVIITNDDHFPSENYLDAGTAQTITAIKTFQVLPRSTSNATNSDEFVRYAQVLALLTGSTASIDRIIIAGKAGETIAAGDVVYLKLSDGRWYKASGALAASSENVSLGIAQGAGTAGNAVASGVLTFGLDSAKTGLTPNTKYYIGDTAGAMVTTPGTKEVSIGITDANGYLYFNPLFDQRLTEDIQDGLEGAVGGLSASNPVLSAGNLSASDVDQQQTTQNASTEVGEANTTLKKNKLAQSFIPTKGKIRGVRLYKAADSGSFTGTVTVALQADTAGSPSGVNLASATFTNAQWLGKAVGEIEVLFSSEYTALAANTTYWIVITTSTSDNTNHPNLGHNSAGGYANGFIKYNNSTDGWGSLTGLDLYFKTLEGNANQGVKTNSSGKIPAAFFDPSLMPIPAFYQRIETTGSLSPSNSESGEQYVYGGTCNSDGSVVIVYFSGVASRLQRFTRNSITGLYNLTHSIAPSAVGTDGGWAIVGDYIYHFYDGGTNMAARRFNLADLTGETALTIPTITASGTVKTPAWTDGTYLYTMIHSSNTVYKLSISGTTLTTVTTGSMLTALYSLSEYITSAFDGSDTYFFQSYDGADGRCSIWKLTDPFAATAVETKFYYNYRASSSVTSNKAIGVFVDTARYYMLKGEMLSLPGTATTVKNFVALTPFPKP